ncbi:MAG: hypothetical protein HYW26_03230 [Candidatus Aenigmarchaeota archaeon]|nr:hypothetical protein [Candidatus Aenigmarchaeota archaeon]
MAFSDIKPAFGQVLGINPWSEYPYVTKERHEKGLPGKVPLPTGLVHWFYDTLDRARLGVTISEAEYNKRMTERHREKAEPEKIKPPPGKMVTHLMETYNPEAQNMLNYILSEGYKPRFDDHDVRQSYYSILEQTERGGKEYREKLYREHGKNDGGRALLEDLCGVLRGEGIEVYPVDNSYFTEGLGEKPGHDGFRISGVNVKVRKGERVKNTVLFDKELKPYIAAAVIAHEGGGHSELDVKRGAKTEVGANAGGKMLLGYRALHTGNPEYLIPLAELVKLEKEDYRIPRELEQGVAVMNPWKMNQFNPDMN